MQVDDDFVYLTLHLGLFTGTRLLIVVVMCVSVSSQTPGQNPHKS